MAYVALLRIDLHFPDSGSLKGKRKELSSVKAQLHGRLGLAVAEVDHQDTWQRSELAGALVSGSLAQLQQAVDRTCRYLDERYPQGVAVHRTVASFDEVESLG